ncbi:MAG: hypothetical protein JNJ85_11485 [Candidatus Kapabacteria bacterium]|nr:hypothetical protein [Candidatus Kapabacteria bacterium]MBX7155568.1 hypothetical protein [Bacteroidota bacterium]
MQFLKYVLLICVFTIVSNAQESRTGVPISTTPETTKSPATTPEPYSVFAGVYLHGKAGMKANVAHGYKTDVTFLSTPDFGAQLLFPFTRNGNLGFGLSIGLGNYGYVNKPESNVTDNNKVIEQYQFISIFPHFNLSGVILGLNMNSASGGTVKTAAGTEVSVVISDTKPDYSKYLNSFNEIVAGVSIPVLDESYGRLNASLLVGYALNGIYKDITSDRSYYMFAYDDNNILGKSSSDNNPKPVSLSVGVSFLFKIPVIK